MGDFVAIDISAVIWDENDFNINRYHYYSLVKELSNLFEEVQKLDVKILLRSELQKEMIIGFLFSELPNEFYYVGKTFYSFFDRVANKLISYPDLDTSNLISIPNQVKSYFKQNTKKEVKYLLLEIHSNTNNTSYLTFEYLWNGNNKLKTSVNQEEKEHNTIIADRNNELREFLDNIIPKFEHNSKHDCTDYNSKEQWLRLQAHDRNSFVSRLSCYCDRDVKKPKKILDEKYPELINDCYYGWDENNEVYVIFRKTHPQKNVFHAYDEYDINKIPEKVKNHFHEWKYKWHH